MEPFSSCQLNTGDSAVNDVEQPILQVFDAYKAAVFAKDVDAFVALYHEDVCVFEMWGTWSYNGIEAWRTMVGEWFGSLGSERVVVELDSVQTHVTNDLAVAYAFISYTGVSAEGKALRTMHNRLTWALKQHGSTWKIVHEHSSAPVDPETLKVLLQR
jgi:uncharacterized protein (TIGR02246 family)